MAKSSSRKNEREQAEESVSEAKRLSSHLIYEVIRRDGKEELRRPLPSLFWSGVAAGMLISFSALGESVLRIHLPEADWAPLVESIGYSLGFLIVILGKMQLFTENTITTVLPVVGKPSRKNYLQVSRLWSVVLFANLVGAFFAAAFIAYSPAFDHDILSAMAEISHEATDHPPFEAFIRAMPAGILVASIVWMLPTTESGRFWVVLMFTWLIAAGGFTHVIAGSVEMAYLLLIGELGLTAAFGGFLAPVLAGNIVGGTIVFSMLAWGQVKEEVDDPDHPDGADDDD